jgi:hypothetical protein
MQKGNSLKSTARWFLAWLIYSSILKMEGICSSETSVVSQQTTRRHISEDKTTKELNDFCSTSKRK